jgi:hypothetical protein
VLSGPLVLSARLSARCVSLLIVRGISFFTTVREADRC